MKTILKFLTLGLFLAAVGTISVTSTFAQATPEECDAIYNQKFLPNRKGPDRAKYQTAVAAGKEYLEKCGTIDQPEVKAYVEKQLPKVQEALDIVIWNEDVLNPFNDSIKNKNWDKTFELGKKIMAKEPDFIDVSLVLASIGFDNAAANPPVDKYNTDALNMAKHSLQKINEGKTSENWGAYNWVYKTKICTDGKTNAIGWMNYTIGFITYNNLKNQKDGVQYLYKSTQVGCETPKNGNIFRMIGAWYIEEFKRIDAKRIIMLEDKTANPTGEDTPETKAMFALQKGYMERVVDAYARASKLAPDTKTKDSWLNRAKEFYGFRFNKDMTNFDKWVSDSTAKPFPDPTAEVTPVIETTPTTTTGAAPGTTSISADTTNSTAADTRPRTATTATTATPAKSAATSATTTATTTTAAKTTTTKKAPAKKPAPKKKGT